MKEVSEIMERLSTSRLSAKAWIEPHPKLNGMAMIDHLFARLDGLYPCKWRSSFPSKESIKNWREVWVEGLVEENITLEEVKAGLKACRANLPWPPSFSEFVSLCRYGGMTEEQLFNIAAIEMEKRRAWKEQNWPSRGLFWAASSLGVDLLSMPYKMIEARWKTALERFCKDRTPIPDTNKAQALESKPSSRETAARNLAEIKTTLGIKNKEIAETQPKPGEQIAIADAIEPLKSFKSIVGIYMPTLAQKNRLEGV